MGDVIDFPAKTLSATNSEAHIEDDPYYRLIKNVLYTADTYGFELPFRVDSAAEHVYRQTRHKSQLARMFAQAEDDS